MTIEEIKREIHSRILHHKPVGYWLWCKLSELHKEEEAKSNPPAISLIAFNELSDTKLKELINVLSTKKKETKGNKGESAEGQ